VLLKPYRKKEEVPVTGGTMPEKKKFFFFDLF